MTTYNLAHLTQDKSQNNPGPIQDDEALLFFALIRVTRIKRILEFGGVHGYSARNFCEAIDGGTVYTVDWGVEGETPKQGENHKVIVKNCADITPEDVDNIPVDLVFFDCHAYEAELCAFQTLKRAGIITDKTIFAFHDTNLLATETSLGLSYEVKDGWVFCPPERQMVNDFKAMGYDILHLGTEKEVHSPEFPYRCGLSIARKFIPLELKFGATAPWMKTEDIESAKFIKVGEFDYKRT